MRDDTGAAANTGAGTAEAGAATGARDDTDSATNTCACSARDAAGEFVT